MSQVLGTVVVDFFPDTQDIVLGPIDILKCAEVIICSSCLVLSNVLLCNLIRLLLCCHV